MYQVEFRFNSVDRWREMPIVPRVGDMVNLIDDGEDVILEVNRVIIIERDRDWQFHCNCEVKKNWID